MQGDMKPGHGQADRWSSLALGALAGLLNGLIALGGGILVTPFLVGHRGLSPQVAVGTSLAVVVLLSTIAFAAHAVQGNLAIGWTQTGICAVGGLLGTMIGSQVLAKLTPRWLLKAFALLLMLIAARLILQGAGLSYGAVPAAVSVPWLALFAIGVVTGIISAIFGVGGGALALLSLTMFYGMPVKEGLPVALALNVSNALSGVVHHARKGHVQAGEVRALIPAAVIGVLVGAWLAQLVPAHVLRVVFGAVLVLLAGRLLWGNR